eukprot:Nk52_evm43s229 gene=Nk52_evmTU43s229
MALVDLISHENNEELMTYVFDSIRNDDVLSLRYLLENRADEDEHASIDQKRKKHSSVGNTSKEEPGIFELSGGVSKASEGVVLPSGETSLEFKEVLEAGWMLRWIVSVQYAASAAWTCCEVALYFAAIVSALLIRSGCELMCFIIEAFGLWEVFDAILKTISLKARSCSQYYNSLFEKKESYTQLHAAASYGSIKCLKYLLHSNFDHIITDPKYLEDSERWKEKKRLNHLLLDLSDFEGWTPIHDAVKGGHIECAKELIRHGCDINVKEAEGNTPLHHAASEGFEDMVRLLLSNGAIVNISNNKEQTPLDIAKKYKKPNLNSILLLATKTQNVPRLKDLCRRQIRAVELPFCFSNYPIANELKEFIDKPDCSS